KHKREDVSSKILPAVAGIVEEVLASARILSSTSTSSARKRWQVILKYEGRPCSNFAASAAVIDRCYSQTETLPDLLQVSETCVMLMRKFLKKKKLEKHLEVPMKFKALCLSGIAIIMLAIPAVAHHSFAMFDASKTVTLQGTVKEFHWTNPHSWIFLTVAGEGQPAEWPIELGSPAGLMRQGWVPKTLT